MNKWGFLDKLWRTVFGLIIMHPILIWRAGKVFKNELKAEYSVTFRDLKEMWKKREHINRGGIGCLKTTKWTTAPNARLNLLRKNTYAMTATNHITNGCRTEFINR